MNGNNILYEKIKILNSEIKLKEMEISEIRKQIFENDFKKWTWDDFEQWLLNNDTGNYEKNPIIVDKYGVWKEYCKIINGKLQIGSYFHNDRFPRGEDLYVSRNFLPYRN